MRRIATVLTLSLLGHATVSAGVVGFNEPFDGQGPFDGFHTEGLSYYNLGHEFVDGTLSFTKDFNDTSPSWLSVPLEGDGGFVVTADFADLSLGPNLGGAISVDLSYVSGSGNGSADARLFMDSGFEPGEWGLIADVLDDRDIDLIHEPERNHPIRLEMTFNAEASSPSVTVSYDSSLEDRDNAPVVVGPFDYPRTARPGQRLDLLFFVGQSSGPMTGRISNLSVVPLPQLRGDFNGDSLLDASDIELLAAAIQSQDITFDLNGDGAVDSEDRIVWIRDLKGTYLGDANLDGEFASSDLVNVFTAGQYEDGIVANSTWASGDWNGDGEFTSGDLVFAFQDGGYEQGPRVASSLPEPVSSAWPYLAIVLLASRRLKL